MCISDPNLPRTFKSAIHLSFTSITFISVEHKRQSNCERERERMNERTFFFINEGKGISTIYFFFSKRERKRDRQTDRQTERVTEKGRGKAGTQTDQERERGRGGGWGQIKSQIICLFHHSLHSEENHMTEITKRSFSWHQQSIYRDRNVSALCDLSRAEGLNNDGAERESKHQTGNWSIHQSTSNASLIIHWNFCFCLTFFASCRTTENVGLSAEYSNNKILQRQPSFPEPSNCHHCDGESSDVSTALTCCCQWWGWGVGGWGGGGVMMSALHWRVVVNVCVCGGGDDVSTILTCCCQWWGWGDDVSTILTCCCQCWLRGDDGVSTTLTCCCQWWGWGGGNNDVSTTLTCCQWWEGGDVSTTLTCCQWWEGGMSAPHWPVVDDGKGGMSDHTDLLSMMGRGGFSTTLTCCRWWEGGMSAPHWPVVVNDDGRPSDAVSSPQIFQQVDWRVSKAFLKITLHSLQQEAECTGTWRETIHHQWHQSNFCPTWFIVQSHLCTDHIFVFI